MARKPKIQTRVERDTKDAIDTYTDDHDDLSQSEAVRHLIRAGLAQKGYPVAAADGGTKPLLERLAAPRTIGLGTVLLVLAAGLMTAAGLLASNGTPAAALVALGLSIVLMVLAAGIVVTAALAQLALARPLRGLVFNVEESETA